MALDRFELLELRRDDGIETYHARELATARPVQVHFFPNGTSPENVALLSRLRRLPETERRRVIDHGMSAGRPYVVTDRLAGFATFREWLESNTTPLTVDQQFFALFQEAPEEAPGRRPPIGRSHPPDHAVVATAARSLLGIVLGVAAALIFLALVVAVVVFRPR